MVGRALTCWVRSSGQEHQGDTKHVETRPKPVLVWTHRLHDELERISHQRPRHAGPPAGTGVKMLQTTSEGLKVVGDKFWLLKVPSELRMIQEVIVRQDGAGQVDQQQTCSSSSA